MKGDMALEELRELIGEQAFQSYQEQGFFTFEVGERTFALADPTRAGNRQTAVQLDKAGCHWRLLCVSPTPDVPIAPHDSTIILYRWIMHRTTNFLTEANKLGFIYGPGQMVHRGEPVHYTMIDDGEGNLQRIDRRFITN